MFQVYIDDNGYYTEGNTGTCVEVEKMPSVSDVHYLHGYRYDKLLKHFMKMQIKQVRSKSRSQKKSKHRRMKRDWMLWRVQCLT